MATFAHPNGRLIVDAFRKANQSFDKARRIADTAQLRLVLKEFSEGLLQFSKTLRLYIKGADTAYRTAEGAFARAANLAGMARQERRALEALADGLIGLSSAIQTGSASNQGSVLNSTSVARQHFSGALSLACAGRQRPVLQEFAIGLKHLAQALFGVASFNADGIQFMRNLRAPVIRFERAADLAKKGRQRPVLKELSNGLDALGDVISAAVVL